MSKLYERIEYLAQVQGMTINALAQKAKITPSTLYDLRRRTDDSGINSRTAAKLAVALNINVNELYNFDDTPPKDIEIIESPPINMDGNSKDVNNSNVIPMKQPLTNGGKIKVLGSVPAGVPVEAVECVIDEIDISEKMAADSNEYFGLLVSGDSMFPEYLDGDIVIVRKQSAAETGDDVVAYVNSYDATLKRLQVMSGGIRLKALNPQYESKFYSNDDVINMPVSILGVVVEMRRTKK